jgi:hypothetical protein
MTLKSKKIYKKNKKIVKHKKTLKNKTQLKKNKNLKPKTLKHKKSLKVGANWGCSKCTFNNPEMNSRCRMCSFQKPKQPNQPVSFAVTLSIEPMNLGLFQYNGNSCWLDSGLFALFITRNNVIHNALFINPLLPLENIMCRAIEVVGDKRGNNERQLFARKEIRKEMILLHKHMFTLPGKRIILKDGLRKLLGSLNLSNLNWGGTSQANSEEFIGIILSLFPVKKEERISIIIRSGYAYDKKDLLLNHEQLLKKQTEINKTCTSLLRQSVNRSLIELDFKYTNVYTEDKIGIMMIIPRYLIDHSNDNFVTPEKPNVFLSELLFGKHIIPESRGNVGEMKVIIEEVDFNCKFKFTSIEKKVKCPGGILLVHLYRIKVPVDIEEESEREMDIDILTTIIIPEFTIYPEGTEQSALYLTAVIVFIGGHYTCYFRYGIEFFLFNDLSSTIEPIGTYLDLINHTKVVTNGVFFIYKASSNIEEDTIIKQNYSIPMRISNPPSDSGGGGGGSAKPTGSRSTTPSILRSGLGTPKQRLTLLKMAKEINIPNYEKMNNETLRKKIDERLTLLDIAKQLNIPNYEKMNNETLRIRIEKRLTLLEQTKGLEKQDAMTNKLLMEYVEEAKKYNLLN